MKRTCPPARTGRLTLALLLALAFAAAGPAFGRVGDGRLLLRWEGALSQTAVLTLVDPAGADQSHEVTPETGETTSGRHLFERMPAGMVRFELYMCEDATTESWEIPLSAELTTVAVLNLSRRTLTIDPAHPDPFGNWESWDAGEIRSLPGIGAGSALSLDTRPVAPQDPVLDGMDLNRSAHLRPRALELESEAALVQLPLGMVPPALSGRTAWVSSGRSPVTSLKIMFGQGIGQRALGEAEGRANFEAGALGRVDGSASIRGLSYRDAGPAGIADDRLPGNKLEALETRARAAFRPGEAGLLRLSFYAFGEQRRHYLHEFLPNSAHNPQEERADLLGAAAYDFRAGPADLSLEAQFQRSLQETGDGLAFDVLDEYNSTDNQNFTSDGLYWSSFERGTATAPHLYNYYVRDLTSTWTLKGEGSMDLLADSPLRAGLELRLASYRWYENMNPANSSAYELHTSHLGYTLDGETRTDEDPFGPAQPRWIIAHASQRLNLGPAAVEAGLRLESFTSGQAPVRSWSDPLDQGNSLTDEDLASEETHTGIDPRAGLYIPLAGMHVWADGGRLRETPPLEALYFSRNVLQHQAGLAATTRIQAGRDLVFGNPALKPESRGFVQLGFLRSLGAKAQLRASGHLAQVSDVWVARSMDAGVDSLNYFDNRGKRREQGLHLDLSLSPQPKTRLRVNYDLSRLETNVIEPSPLYRAWMIPGSPVEGTGVRETAPLTPLWMDDGVDRDYFPSLFDRRHRLALTVVTQVEKGQEGGMGELIGDFSFGAAVRAASGRPYTPTYVEAEGQMRSGDGSAGALVPGRPVDENVNGLLDADEINSGRMPWTWELDLSFQKQFGFLTGDVGLLLEVLNVTGQENAVQVYGATGEPDDDGWLAAPANPAQPTGPTNEEARGEDYAAAYRDRLHNPMNYQEGRVVRFALSYKY